VKLVVGDNPRFKWSQVEITVSGTETISHGNCVRTQDSANGTLRFTAEMLEFQTNESDQPIWTIRLEQIQRLSLIGPKAVVVTDEGRTDFEGSEAERITRALAEHLKGPASAVSPPGDGASAEIEDQKQSVPEPGAVPFPKGKIVAEEMCVWLPGTQALAGMMAVTPHGIAFSRDLSAAMMTSNVVWALSVDQVKNIAEGEGNTTCITDTDGAVYRFMGQGAARAGNQMQQVLDGKIQEIDVDEPVDENENSKELIAEVAKSVAEAAKQQRQSQKPTVPTPPPVPATVAPLIPTNTPVPDEVILKERFTQRRGPISVPGTMVLTTKGFRFDTVGALSFVFGGDLRAPLKTIQNVKYTSNRECEIWVNGAIHLFRGSGAERLFNALNKLRKPPVTAEATEESTSVIGESDQKPPLVGLLPISRILGNLQQLTVYLGNEPLFIALGSSVFLLDDGLGFAFPRVPPTQLSTGMRIRCEAQKELGTYVFDTEVIRTGNKNFDVANDERESWYMLVVKTPHGVQTLPTFHP